MLSTRCEGSIRVPQPASPPRWWLLQSRWVGGYQRAQREVWPRMHRPPQRFGSSRGAEPGILEAPQGPVLPCPCPWKTATSPEPGLGTPRSCLAASRVENVALVSLIGAICEPCIWDGPQTLQVPVLTGTWQGRLPGEKPGACPAGVHCGPLPSFFPSSDLY